MKATKKSIREAEGMQRKFGDQFLFRGGIGTIEGGDGTPVQITLIISSWAASEIFAERFGYKPGERALLVEWIPAGMQFTNMAEAGVDEDKILPREQWVVFPRSFDGLPVYYRRGQRAFAS